MKTWKKLAGLMLFALGGVGCIAFLIGVVLVWLIRGWADDTTIRVLERVDVAIGKVETRAGQATQRVMGVRDSLHALNERVQQRIADVAEVPTEEAADIDELERQLYAAFDRLSDWLGLLRDSAELVQQVRDIIESSSTFLQDDPHPSIMHSDCKR